jgi:hypothetical protein
LCGKRDPLEKDYLMWPRRDRPAGRPQAKGDRQLNAGRMLTTLAAIIWLFYVAGQPSWMETLSGFAKGGILLGGVAAIVLAGGLAARILGS